MHKLIFSLFVIISTSSWGQFSIIPHNVGISYVGETVTHPGGKLSLMYNLAQWNKVNKSQRGLAKTKRRNTTLNVNFGGFYHQRFQTGIFFLPEIEFSESNKKGWYWAAGAGAGYLRTIIPDTYEVQDDGTVEAVNAGHNYGMASIYFTYGKDLFIQNKKPWRFFLKPQFVMAFPNFPTLTGYFLLEVGVAYKLRQF
jgi:hypothetical protein